jgi:TonB family protein
MYCRNCGQQVNNDNAIFCKKCGINLKPSTMQSNTAIVEQPAQVQSVPPPPPPLPPPAFGNTSNNLIGNIPPSFRSSNDTFKKGWLIGVGVFVILNIIGVIGYIFFYSETKYSSLSEKKQEKLITELHKYLDQHNVSNMQFYQQVAQDISESYLWNPLSGEDLENIIRQEIENKTAIEVREIIEKWATDNNIDLEDLTNNNVIEVLFEDYISNLTGKIADDAIALMIEMKATIREGLAWEAENDNTKYTWIVGDWINSETDREFTFEADDTFSTGDDCISTGIYKIRENTVYLYGKTVCPDCEDCEENDYNETITINGQTLEGYNKVSTSISTSTTANITNWSSNSSEPIFEVVDEMPAYPGGETGLMNYIVTNLKYPERAIENNIQGRVYLKFVVTSRGNIGEVRVISGVDPELDAEAVRVIKTITGFRPGRQDGKVVSVWYQIPITFQLR